MGDAKGGFLGWFLRSTQDDNHCSPKSCPGAAPCVPVTGMCVAVLHSVIIGAEKTAFGKTIFISAYNATLCNTAWEVLRSGALNSKWKVDFNAATGSWRKSAAEFTELPYGFLPLSENSLLPFTQCAVAAMLQKV